jgi:hypothetical protein
LQDLQVYSNAAAMNSLDSEIPDDVKADFEEWYKIVDEALARFDHSLKCLACGHKHDCAGIEEAWLNLRKVMEEATPEEISDDMVEQYQITFGEIWRVYVEARDGCVGL